MVRRRSAFVFTFVSAAVVLSGAVAACGSFGSTEESAAAPDAQLGADALAAADAAGADASGRADARQLEGMVEVPKGKFFIDAHEVTNAQYTTFLLALNGGVAASDERSECSWTTTHERVTTSCKPAAIGEAPATCVDWCDANAFCRHYGKRLCGKFGGGSADLASLTSAAHSQWMLACGGVNGAPYPYADGGVGTCTTQSSDMGLVPVGSKPGCVGNVEGLFDMSGNALEWEDANGAPTDGGAAAQQAFARGGSFRNPIASCMCSYVSPPYARKQIFDNIGFRCCSP